MFAASEVVDFQNRSRVGERLTAIFQKVIDFRDSLEYDPSWNLEEIRNYRVTTVVNKFSKSLSTDFIKIVKEEIGMEVQSLHLNAGIEMGVTCLFAVMFDPPDFPAFIEAVSKSAGGYKVRQTANQDLIKEIEKTSELVDLKNAKFKSNRFGNHKVTCRMFFDFNMAFLLQDFITVTEDELLTADELAAIMLHEIGHMVTLHEHMADTFFRLKRIETHTANLSTTADCLTFIKDIVPTMKAQLTKLADMGTTLDKDSAKPIHAICTMASGLLDTAELMANSIAKLANPLVVVRMIAGISINVLIFVVRIAFNVFMTSFLFSAIIIWATRYCNTEFWYHNDLDVKSGDVISVTRRNNVLPERWADEYATRLGYGPQLISALNKLVRVMERYGYADRFSISAALRSSTVFMWILEAEKYVLRTISVGNYITLNVYEPNIERNYRIVQNMRAYFKDKDIPPKLAREWLNKLARAEDSYQQQKRILFIKNDSGLGTTRQTFRRFCSLALNPFKLTDMLLRSQLGDDYLILYERLDDTRNNSLFAQSYRLKYE